MSTTINVYPATSHMPLVEETRARTQELFQQLLDRWGIAATIEVEAFNRDAGEAAAVEADLRWHKGLRLAFDYRINGEWDSNSWPMCFARDPDSAILEEDLISDDDPDGAAPEFLGQWWIVEEFTGVVPPDTLSAILSSDHYWGEHRNMGGPAVSSTGYGLVMAALAEATDGVIASFDCAFSDDHNGETADQFLSWWGDSRIDFYGAKRFRSARMGG